MYAVKKCADKDVFYQGIVFVQKPTASQWITQTKKKISKTFYVLKEKKRNL